MLTILGIAGPVGTTTPVGASAEGHAATDPDMSVGHIAGVVAVLVTSALVEGTALTYFGALGAAYEIVGASAVAIANPGHRAEALKTFFAEQAEFIGGVAGETAKGMQHGLQALEFLSNTFHHAYEQAKTPP